MSRTDTVEKSSVQGIEMLENGKLEEEPTASFTHEELEMQKRLLRKIDVRLLPTTAVIYLLCYLDRSNIGNARILNADTKDDILSTNNISPYDFTIALMVFLVAYSLFEAPSNLALKILSPKRWLGFLTIAFGAICAGIGGTNNVAGVTALRFFLGAAEAGVFPGMIYYFSFWYSPKERASRIAVFLCSATLSGAFGGCIAYGVGHMNGYAGLEAWRWLFILEGIPAVVVGILVFFFLPNYPEHAGWLTDEEKALQVRRMGIHSNASESKISWKDAKATLLTWRFYGHYIAYSAVACGVSSLSLFSPTIVRGLGYQSLDAQLYTVPPYAVAYVVTMVLAFVSDRYKSRGVVAAPSLVVGAIAYAIAAALPGNQFKTRYALLIIATTGTFGCLPPLCAWVADNSRTTTEGALSTALNIAFAGPGQIVGVWIYRTKDAPSFKLGHGVNAGFSILAAFTVSVLAFYYRRLNAKMAGTNELRWVA